MFSSTSNGPLTFHHQPQLKFSQLIIILNGYFHIFLSTSMDIFTFHHHPQWIFSHFLINHNQKLSVRFTKAIFSVSITFTDACQRRFFLLQICRVVGDLIEHHHRSHVRDPMSWRYNDMIYEHDLFVQLDCRWHGYFIIFIGWRVGSLPVPKSNIKIKLS
jgi:hypothetical protein